MDIREVQRQLTPQEIQVVDQNYKKAILDPVQRDFVYDGLRTVFAQLSSVEDRVLLLCYFRWYVNLTWRVLNRVSPEEFENIAIRRQIPVAILLDYDVLENVMWYFNARVPEASDMTALFSKVRDAFVGSEAILGTWQGKEVTVAEAVKQMKLIMSYDNDTIQMAEFRTKLKQMMFPKREQNELFYKYFTIDPDVATERFVDLLEFFLTVEPDDIKSVVDGVIYPEEERTEDLSVKSSEAASSAEKRLSIPDVKSVKTQINSQFRKSADGNYEDIDGVFAKLDELSRKYNDPKIAEMLYWDEAKGQFVWQE